MGMLTIRLNSDDSEKAIGLRQQGVEISQLVRDAIRSEYDRRLRPRKIKDAAALLDEILRRHPAPADAAGGAPSSLNRKAFAQHVRRRLKQGSSR